MLNPEKKYNYDYYMNLVDQIVKMGAHVLGIKDSTYIIRPCLSHVLTLAPTTFSGRRTET